MEGSTFRLSSRDRNAGTVYLPCATTGPVPVVISCHGRRSDQRLGPFLQAVCETLTSRGAALVAFDFFGAGATGGDPAAMTYGRWESNLRDVVTYVLHQPWARPDAVGCLGMSVGSMVALRLAERDRRPAFLISVATSLGTQGRYEGSAMRTLVDNMGTLLAGGTVEYDGRRAGLPFFQDLVRRAPAYRIDRIPIPILLLQGTNDNVWRRGDAWVAHAKRKASGMPVRYVDVPGGDHSLSNRPRVGAREVAAWLEEIAILPPAQPQET